MTDDLDLRPENRANPAIVVVGLYRIWAREADAQVPATGDLEFDCQVYMDGSIVIDNDQGPDHGQYHRVRLTPSQVAQLRILINDPTVVRPYRPEE